MLQKAGFENGVYLNISNQFTENTPISFSYKYVLTILIFHCQWKIKYNFQVEV